jgi:predicted hydrolase (HD superfamily)
MISNEPISEQFRIVAKEWVAADSAANLLEESKSATLSQRMMALGDMPVSRAEMTVKASTEWTGYLEAMNAARERANLLKVKLEYLRMRFSENQSAEASKRAEMRL